MTYRLNIQRCILKDAPVVILDEATASVDADQILVVSDGQIRERGDHEKLIAQSGMYAHMVALQA